MEAICHVDNNGKLVGITTDADLRRGDENIINFNPQTIYENSSYLGLVREYIPVVDYDFHLKSVLFRPKEQVFRLEEKPKQISIVGLGYVGLTLAIAFAKKGIHVYCFDKNKDLLELIKKKELPFYEYGLKEAFNEAFEYITLREISQPVTTENVIVTVGTPLRENKEVDLNYLYNAIDQICESAKKNNIKNIILRSTVPVGTCKKLEIHVKIHLILKLTLLCVLKGRWREEILLKNFLLILK